MFVYFVYFIYLVRGTKIFVDMFDLPPARPLPPALMLVCPRFTNGHPNDGDDFGHEREAKLENDDQ